MDKIRPIQKLSGEVIGQIAAGEVVERPASVVKELVENSIDAAATAITVELREGGISYLRVSDNGRGIPSAQIRMAFERHATSKLVSSADLFDVHTLGFRGEALASIAAVAKVTMTTHTQAEDFGIRAQVEAGEIKDIREAAAPVGTTILVQELFFNTPVRLKFLKKPSLEASLVSDYMMRLILSRPDIAFRFVNQGKTIYQSVGDGNMESALYCVFGKDAMRHLKKVQGTKNGLVLDGYVGVGELSRGNRQLQSFFINGRYFRDMALSKALENGCQGLVMVGKFPCCALYLQLPYQQVDVNVHPNKLEVRFQDLPRIVQAVEALVKEAVREESLENRLQGTASKTIDTVKPEEFQIVDLELETVPTEEKESPKLEKEGYDDESAEAIAHLTPVRVHVPSRVSELREGYAPMQGVQTYTAVERPSFSAAVRPEVKAAEEVFFPKEEETPQQESLLEEETTAPLRFIGIAFKTYWLFESGERLLWVDQHAAHERILYDKLWKQLEGSFVSQRLLSPQLVSLTAAECALVEELKPEMEAAGFEVEAFDETSVAVHAIPTIFGKNNGARELLLEALSEWQSFRGQVTRERMRKQVIQMACKHAIKAGDALSDTEVSYMLQEMLSTGMIPTCPHGRPIVVETGRRDFEKRFKRIQ